MNRPTPIAIDQAVLDDLARRLAATRLPDRPQAESTGWDDGIDGSYLTDLVAYWRDQFDWRRQEAALNRFEHFHGDVAGMPMHWIHARGTGPAPFPLVLAHGWPDSFLRFVKLIPLLTDPAAHGGDAADAFDIVVPSLPGYGFSRREGRHADAYGFGTLFHALMTEQLGYQRYGAHGGDIGSSVCEQLARSHVGSVVGVHLTDVPVWHAKQPPDDVTLAEKAYLAQVEKFQKDGGGYMHEQGTKPWTLATGLDDSPAGLAAWIVEKFHDWSDCHGDIESRFTKDELLTNVMLYWATQTIGTSFLAYRDFTKIGLITGVAEAAKKLVGSHQVPAGFALFPKDIATAPRSWAERFFHVERWTSMPAGGHFAALEEPALLAEELRAFFRPLRAGRAA